MVKIFFSKTRLYYFAIAASLSAITISPVHAANSWTFGFTPQLLMTQYNDSQQRDTLLGYGMLLSADYLDQSGVAFGYNSQTVNGKTAYPDITETSLYISGHYISYLDSLGGKLSLRIDKYNIDDQTKATSSTTTTTMGKKQTNTTINTSVETLTDNIGVIYAQVDFLNFTNTIYADMGYARSRYNYDDSALLFQDNNVSQYTVTAGFALNNRYDWIQARGYFIHLDQGNNTAGVSKSNALELKWLHWFKPGNYLHANSTIVNLVLGKRLFPVDPDTQTAYSIADLQTGSAAVGLDWKIGEQSKFLLTGGYDRFENLATNDKYSTYFIFGGLSFKWRS